MKQILSLVFSLFLFACGGGSGGGGSLTPGTYTVIGTLTLVSPSPPGPRTEPFLAVVVINPNGTVVIDPGTPEEASGTVNGNNFTVNVGGYILNEPGVKCTGTLQVTGSGGGANISGTFQSIALVCNGIAFVFTGKWTGSLNPARASSGGNSISDSLKSVIRSN